MANGNFGEVSILVSFEVCFRIADLAPPPAQLPSMANGIWYAQIAWIDGTLGSAFVVPLIQAILEYPYPLAIDGVRNFA